MLIAEALGGSLSAQPTHGSLWRARLIEGDRQGASAFYPRDVLQRDAAATWPVGTPVYFDHPTESERFDRPERSVRDLAGRIDSVPVYEGDGVYANIRFYSWAAPVVAEMAGDVGMSIRASATVEASRDPSIRGPIATSLSDGESVDLVTKAGAGGKLVALLESARSRPVAEATTGEVREELERAVRAAHGSDDDRWIYVRDFDDTRVWFAIDSGDESALWEQGYTLADGAVTLTGDRVEVRARTDYVPVSADASEAARAVAEDDAPTTTDASEASHQPPVAPAGSTPIHESEEDTMSTTTIEEARLRQLEADAGRVQTLESERDTARTERDTERAARLVAENRAAAIEAIANSGHPFSALERRGLLADIPVTEAGTLDAEKFGALIAQEAAGATGGASGVTGFGQSTNPESTDLSEAELDKELAAFGGRTPVKEA